MVDKHIMKNHLFSTKRDAQVAPKAPSEVDAALHGALLGITCPGDTATFCAWNDGKSVWQILYVSWWL